MSIFDMIGMICEDESDAADVLQGEWGTNQEFPDYEVGTTRAGGSAASERASSVRSSCVFCPNTS